MATAAERMRAHRERARRGHRRFTISASADDLPVIAEHGYEGVLLAMRALQAPTTISRLKPSACSSTTPFCKSDRQTIAEAERHDCLPRPHRLISGQMTSYA